jgi:hypothetical protein
MVYNSPTYGREQLAFRRTVVHRLLKVIADRLVASRDSILTLRVPKAEENGVDIDVE